MPSDLFSDDVISSIRINVQEATGNEVFFVGSFNGGAVIDEVMVVARGNSYAVPAVIDAVRPGDVVIHNHPSGDLTPSAEDLQIASVLGNEGVGFYIVNNSVSEVYVVVEPFSAKEIEPLDIENVKDRHCMRPQSSSEMGGA